MDEPNAVPRFPLRQETLIREVITEEPLAWVDGVLPLPVGGRFRMTQVAGRTGTWDAIVQEVGTLPVGDLGGQRDNPAVSLVLEVMLVQPESP